MPEVLVEADKRGLEGVYSSGSFIETNANRQIVPSLQRLLSIKLLGDSKGASITGFCKVDMHIFYRTGGCVDYPDILIIGDG